ncbi:MAG TPA: ABC transporter permease, partial [Burkholderiaceae bacterium]
MLWRDWRAGELRFLFLAVAVAVGAQAGVGFSVERLRGGLVRDASQLLGADLALTADRPIAEAWRAAARARGLAATDTVEMQSMARVGAGAAASSRLVALLAAGEGYPQRGQLRVREGAGDAPTHALPAPGHVWIDRDLAERLGARAGTPVTLGDRGFVVERILTDEPARGGALLRTLPRVLMARADLASTGLLQPASRAQFQLLVSGDEAAVRALEKDWRAQVAAGRARGVQV